MSLRVPRLSRRTFLEGSGGLLIALPFLEAMEPAARAQDAEKPRRFLAWWTPVGTILDAWVPQGEGTNYQLSPILRPLERHKGQILPLSGMHLSGQGWGHADSATRALTGWPSLRGSFGFHQVAAQRSLDQEIAASIGGRTRIPSLQLGVQVIANSADCDQCISYAGPGLPLLPQNDPYEVFRLLFGNPGLSSTDLTRARAKRKSVLDAVSRNSASFLNRLGPQDKRTIEAHLTTIRDLERRLDGEIAGGRCEVPSLGDARIDLGANDNVPALGRLQMDLLLAAFSCDITRVATLMWGSAAGGGRVHSWLGIPGDWHGISHDADDLDPAKLTGLRQKYIAINGWYSEQLAYFLDGLKSRSDERGPLLDNTLIYCLNEYGDNIGSASHAHTNVPFLLAGNIGGYFKMGRHLRFPSPYPSSSPEFLRNTFSNRIHTSILHAFGIPAENFGDPADGKGPLPGLKA